MMAELSRRVRSAVRAAGVVALNRQSKCQDLGGMDIEIDSLLYAGLRNVLPESSWFSEERRTTESVPTSGLAWIVDPIDGTRDLIRGRPGWAVSVCLVKDLQLLVGALAVPARGEIWHAVRGGGAWRNGKRLTCSRRKHLAGARIAANAVPHRDRHLVCVGRPYSLAVRVGMVASDEADLATSFSDIHVWDVAAALLIAKEAGAQATTACNREIKLDASHGAIPSLVVANPSLHVELIAEIAQRACFQ